MGMKQWLSRAHPAPLHLVLLLSVLYFVCELVVCHLTHSLTLFLDACHMLCNNIALVGCIMTLKSEAQMMKSTSASVAVPAPAPTQGPGEDNNSNNSNPIMEAQAGGAEKPKSVDERQLRNTFGWARIEVLTMLVVCVFFAALCFSVSVEALQTLIHIDHMDAMHNPLVVLCMGALGLLLNGFCYLLIGGYTFHQGSFLHVTASGDVVLDSVVTEGALRQGQRRLSRTRRSHTQGALSKGRQGLLEATRDVMSCLIVIGCSLVVYLVEEDIAKYVDPALAILSAIILLSLTFPFMKESGLILLQTIPDTMNIEELSAELLKEFPDIVNIHDFHVWQFTTSKVVSTVHIIFESPETYAALSEEVLEFLKEQGITQVTIQPEFSACGETCVGQENPCLMRCKGLGCNTKHCCRTNTYTHTHKPGSQEQVTEAPDEEITEAPAHNSCSGHAH